MFAGQQQNDLVGVDLGDLQPLLLNGKLRDSEIGQVIQHRAHHARSVGAVHRKLDVRKFLFVFGEDHRQDVDAGGFVGGDHQLTARHVLQLVDGVLGAAPKIQDLFGVTGEDLAGGGQCDFGPQPFEQRGVQLLLELAHLRADGRLRAITRLRRFRKTFQADNLKKRVQLIEIHWTPGRTLASIGEVCINCNRGRKNSAGGLLLRDVFPQPEHQFVEAELVGFVARRNEAVGFLRSGGEPHAVDGEKRLHGCERDALVAIQGRMVLREALPECGSFLNPAGIIASLWTVEGGFQQPLIADAVCAAIAADVVVMNRPAPQRASCTGGRTFRGYRGMHPLHAGVAWCSCASR